MLKEGTTAPALSEDGGGAISSIDGTAVSLSQLSRRGPVVLVFLRGFS